MRVLTLDCETSTIEKGSPFHPDNRIAVVAYRVGGITRVVDIEYSGGPYAEALKEIQEAINDADILIAAEAKLKDLVLISNDKDFENIEGLQLLKTEQWLTG